MRTVSLDGWTTTVTGGGDLVTTFTESPVPIDDVEEMARRRTNEAVDYLCAVQFLDALLSKADSDFIIWGTDPNSGSVALRVSVIASGSFEFSAEVRMLDENGVAIFQPRPAPRPHAAMRFVRIARTANSRLDAYRNLCLALESLLHKLHPHVRKG